MLSDTEKVIIYDLHKSLLPNTRKSKNREIILTVLERHRQEISSRLLKYIKIRCLLSQHYIIYRHYVESIAYKELHTEVLKYLESLYPCKVCGKTKPLRRTKSGVSFLKEKREYCSQKCRGQVALIELWKKLRADPEFAKARKQKIQATMLKRYGGKTTMESPGLKEKAVTTRKANKEKKNVK